MPRKGWKTAEEVLADPAVARVQEEARRLLGQRQREAALASADVLRRLAEAGYEVFSAGAIAKSFAPLPPSLCELLLDEIPLMSHRGVKESLIRALGASERGRVDGARLAQIFEDAEDESLRWAVANTIAEARPTGIGDWVLRAIAVPEYGKAREMLLLAAARLAPRAQANERLLALFDEFPGHVALALRESGEQEEARFLTERLPRYHGWVRKEMEKAIRDIARRSGPET